MNTYQDGLKGASLEARSWNDDGVPVHRVGEPGDDDPGLTDGPDEVRELLPKIVGAHANNDGEPARLVLGVEDLTDAHKLHGIHSIARL
jgi:hypothetical protein